MARMPACPSTAKTTNAAISRSNAGPLRTRQPPVPRSKGLSAMSEISPFIAALPKTELHLHLVGSASPETVLELSRNHPEAGLPIELGHLVEFYTFRDFPHFI